MKHKVASSLVSREWCQKTIPVNGKTNRRIGVLIQTWTIGSTCCDNNVV